MSRFFGYELSIQSFPALVIFILGWTAISFFIARLFNRYIRRWAERTESPLGRLLVETLRGPLLLLLLLIGGHIVLEVADLPAKVAGFAHVFVSWATALILIFAGIRIFNGLLQQYGQRYEPIKPSLGILNLLGKALIVLIGILITLDSLHISITPLLTTLGIGGVAVALAFKDTLANFFAGLYILVDRPIRLGDYIKIESGPEGYVEEVGWRSTRIRSLSNNIVVIPNAKLSESVITNYFLPERRMALSLNIAVSYASEPRRVEEILAEEAGRAAAEMEGLLADPPPIVRFTPGFGEYALQFTLICQVREFADQYLVQHELRHRILARFRKEGIEIPFPERTVHLRQEG